MVTGNQANREAPFLPADCAASTFRLHFKWRDDGFCTSDCPRLLSKYGLTSHQGTASPA